MVIIDSFVAELPLFTTNGASHGPEFGYLHTGVNGVTVEREVEAYSNIVAEYLLSDDKRQRLIEGCKASARTLSLDMMVERFGLGIQQCLTIAESRKSSTSRVP